MTERSSGHLAFDSKFEYLVYEGEVYRAPLDCPIRADVPIRNGARWFARSVEAAQRIFDSYPEHLRFPEGGPTVDQTILPLAVSDQVARIAEYAQDAAFRTIAEALEELGYPVTGDVAPDEALRLDHDFQGYVLKMAMNNDELAAMQEEAGMESSVLRDQIQDQIREGRLAPEDLSALAETIRRQVST